MLCSSLMTVENQRLNAVAGNTTTNSEKTVFKSQVRKKKGGGEEREESEMPVEGTREVFHS